MVIQPLADMTTVTTVLNKETHTEREEIAQRIQAIDETLGRLIDVMA